MRAHSAAATLRRPGFVASAWLTPERLILGGAVLALLVLVVYPTIYLVWGAVNEDGALSLTYFARTFGSPLNYNALLNTIYLGLGTSALSVAFGVPIAWAVSRTDMPAE